MDKINIAVLMGGKSAEREVSLSTGKMILGALDKRKYNAIAVDAGFFGTNGIVSMDNIAQDLPPEMLPLDYIVNPLESQPKPDVVFIALHGRFGEDGTVQGLLELLGIPYVGSGVLASALAMDKIMARKVMQYEGVPVPGGIAVRRPVNEKSLKNQVEQGMGFPVVVKPNREGSTIGISIARSISELSVALGTAFSHDEDVLIEEFVEGIEITGAVLGNTELQVLPLVEIVPASGFYDYHSKYTPGATEEIVPARIPGKPNRYAQELALVCHRILGCRGMSRTDMIVRDNDVYVLEVNTIPGMTTTSLLPRAALAAGIGFPKLLDMLIGFALEGVQSS